MRFGNLYFAVLALGMLLVSGCVSVESYDAAGSSTATPARLKSGLEEQFDVGVAGGTRGVQIWAFDDEILIPGAVNEVLMPEGQHCVQVGYSNHFDSVFGWSHGLASSEFGRMAYLCFPAEAGQTYDIVHKQEKVRSNVFQTSVDRSLYWIRRSEDGQVVAGPQPGNHEVTTSKTADHGLAGIARDSRVSDKSFSGGGNSNVNGIYLEPVVVNSLTNDDTSFIGLLVANLDGRRAALDPKSFDRLGLPTRITFKLDDGEVIDLPVEAGDPEWALSVDFYPKKYTKNSLLILETGFAGLRPEQFEQIVKANSYSLEIEGANQVVSYTATELHDNFRNNLRKFYEQHVRY